MEPFDFGRRMRDLVIPDIRKKYHLTGQHLSLEAAAEVIQVARLALLTAGAGELTAEQLSELGTVLEHQVHQQFRPRTGGKEAIVAEIERHWSERQAAPATRAVPHPTAPWGVRRVAVIALLGMLLGVGVATLFFYSRGLIRHGVSTGEMESAIFAKATRDMLAQQLTELRAKIAGHRCPSKTWEDEQKEVLASQVALVKATEFAEYARGRLDGLAHPRAVTVLEPTTYHMRRVLGAVSKMVQDEKNLLPRGITDQARSELLRTAIQQGHVCK